MAWQGQAQQGGAADRTAADVAAGEVEELLLVRWALLPRRGRRHAEERARRSELGVGGVEADVADLVEAVGQHVLHEAPEELDRREGLGAAAAGAEDDALGGDVEQRLLAMPTRWV